jgi:hypothetical protein
MCKRVSINCVLLYWREIFTYPLFLVVTLSAAKKTDYINLWGYKEQ